MNGSTWLGALPLGQNVSSVCEISSPGDHPQDVVGAGLAPPERHATTSLLVEQTVADSFQAAPLYCTRMPNTSGLVFVCIWNVLKKPAFAPVASLLTPS